MTTIAPEQDGSPAPSQGTPSWDAYLARISAAAREVARERPLTAPEQLAKQEGLPECGPPLLAATVAAAVRDELGQRNLDPGRWLALKPGLQRLVACVLSGAGQDRLRALAVVILKHDLGLPLGEAEPPGQGPSLAEAALDVNATGDDRLDVVEATAVQIQAGGARLGLAYLTGREREAGIPARRAIAEQVDDLPLPAVLSWSMKQPRFWGMVAGETARSLRETGARSVPAVRQGLKSALSSAARRAIAERIDDGSRHDQAARLRSGPMPLPILMYHRVADDGDPALARYRVTPLQFDRQLEWLNEAGFTAVSLRQVAEARKGGTALPPRSVLITFDDGYRDFHEHAWPRLLRRRMPSVMFVVSGKVGGTSNWDLHLGRPEPIMSWDQIREIAAGDVEIGSHTVLHPRFSTLGMEAAAVELGRSAAMIEEALGRRPASFCYPYGIYDPLVERLLPTFGYEWGFTCDPETADIRKNPLRLPRIEVMGSWSTAEFAAAITAASRAG